MSRANFLLTICHAVTATLLNFVRMFKKAYEENCKMEELERKKKEKEQKEKAQEKAKK